jgi:tRNA A37 N6-isopentenylltransferase MiaA
MIAIPQHNNYAEKLEKSKYHLKIADHMMYSIFPLLNDYRLFSKILTELGESAKHLISAILEYEFTLKRIKLYKNPETNLHSFRKKLAKQYMDQNDLKNILNILEIYEKHQNSPSEFVKKDKFIILIEDKYEVITKENLKESISRLKNILRSINLQ